MTIILVEQKRITHLKASLSQEEMGLTWDSTDSEINGYIIECYDELEKSANKRSWYRIKNVTEWTTPKGMILRLLAHTMGSSASKCCLFIYSMFFQLCLIFPSCFSDTKDCKTLRDLFGN